MSLDAELSVNFSAVFFQFCHGRNENLNTLISRVGQSTTEVCIFSSAICKSFFEILIMLSVQTHCSSKGLQSVLDSAIVVRQWTGITFLCLTVILALIIIRQQKFAKYYQSIIADFLLQAQNPIMTQTCTLHNSSHGVSVRSLN